MARSTFALWDKIFEVKAFDVTQDLHFITPNEIKAITNKEPRLMAKMDNTGDVPPVFKRHGYFLLSVGNKGYAIVRGNGFKQLEAVSPEPEEFTSRIKFNLTTSSRGTSEMQYLDYCANAGLIEHVIGDGTLYPSIRGREGSGSFSFNVDANRIDMVSAQIEVDLGLEGENKIVLIEAKSKTPEDFIIRQLYYPYRRFKNLSPDKVIVPVFFTYDFALSSYNFWVYKFLDDNDYNSIQLVSKSSYKIVTAHEIKIEELQPVIATAILEGPIPQANDLDRVLELVFIVSQGHDNAAAAAGHFGFEPRQSSYYRQAAAALGLMTLENSRYVLTANGKYLLTLGIEERNIQFSKILTGFGLVRAALDLLKSQGKLTKSDLEHLIAERSELTGSTIGRRADSLMAWLRWIADKTGSFRYEGAVFTLG